MPWCPGKFTRGTHIIPYGPGMQYATVNDLPDWAADAKLPILDNATGIVSACCWVFSDSGYDYVDCGVPSFLTSSCRPGVDTFSAHVVGMRVSTSANYNPFFESATDISGSSASRWIQIAQPNISGSFPMQASCGGAQFRNDSNPISIQNFHRFSVFSAPGIENSSAVVDGVLQGSFTSNILAGNPVYFKIGAGFANYNTAESTIAQVFFLDATGVVIDCYDFTDPTKWNGGTTIVSCAGNTATFTDGAPIGIRKKAAIPRNLLAY